MSRPEGAEIKLLKVADGLFYHAIYTNRAQHQLPPFVINVDRFVCLCVFKYSFLMMGGSGLHWRRTVYCGTLSHMQPSLSKS